MGRVVALRLMALCVVLLLSACGGGGGRVATGSAGNATSLECAPFARQATGIELYGQAYSWWDQADGRYDKGADPVPGGVLVFRRTGRLPYGHVSVVARQVSGREIKVTQANWVHRRITRNETVVDVSPGNDWSAVRVWWAPSNTLGVTVFPTYGFIAPSGPGGGRRGRADVFAGLDAR